MVKQEYVALLRQGVEHWNQWRQEQPDVQPDLREADLRGLLLRGVELRHVDLSEANLSELDLRDARLDGAVLRRADLSNANLREASLRGATLRRAFCNGVDLSGADLSKADLYLAQLSAAHLHKTNLTAADLSFADLDGSWLHEANLSFADLTETSLRGADLRGASIGSTIFAHLDLREVIGLVEIKHLSSSRVELHSVRLPGDGSTLDFLRGVGIPDAWIEFYQASTTYPIHYHSCFICHAHQDEPLARRLHTDLQNHGVRCWLALENLKIGEKIHNRIYEEIHVQEKLLLLLSKHALESSWVEDEVEIVFVREREESREVLFPVRLDDEVMQTSRVWAKRMRQTRQIGDFTHWSEQKAYQVAFQRLLQDLQKEND
ncbi:MAG TPA: toll/interleukin-1 receptor domain-containing protein [Ktedonobacteraceae bacterium]